MSTWARVGLNLSADDACPASQRRDPLEAAEGGPDIGSKRLSSVAAALPGLPLFGTIRVDVLLLWLVLTGVLALALAYLLCERLQLRLSWPLSQWRMNRRMNCRVRSIPVELDALDRARATTRTRAGRRRHPDYHELLCVRHGRRTSSSD